MCERNMNSENSSFDKRLLNGNIDSEVSEKLINTGYELPELDYKEKFDGETGSWMELAKDVYGMANNGGGFIVLGVKDGSFEPVGVEEDFHIDSQVWSSKISKWVTEKINISYFEYKKEINNKKVIFPILLVHGSVAKLVIPKTNGNYKDKFGQEKTAFVQGVVYTRDNTSTVTATGSEYWKLFWSLLQRTASVDSNEIPMSVLSALNTKATPDKINETLWFNLFPVDELPDHIYNALTNYRDPREIYNHIREVMPSTGIRNYEIPPFILVDKKIYSFSPFEETNPLSFCTTRIDSTINTEDWLNDPNKHQNLTMLLNFSLKSLCKKKRFSYDHRKMRYFIPYYNEIVPEVTWKPYKRTTTRKLIHIKRNKSGNILYYEHFAAKMRFSILGNGVYLSIEPMRVLTVDGTNPLDQHRNVRITTKNNFWYHNNNYLYDIKLWLHILAGNKEEIHMGRNPHTIKVSVKPLDSEVQFGILHDRYTGEDFLDELKSEPLEYVVISEEEPLDDNPLTQTSMEESI